MVVGFNHNFSYKGQVYHVQTEDSGVKNPHIITLLYRGGTILSSKKTSYADIIKIDNLEVVVEELMKSQHREMLRLLKNGDLDELLGLPLTPAKAVVPPPVVAATPLTVPPAAMATTTASAPVTPPINPPEKRTAPAPASPPPPSPTKLSLDEIILSYMVGEDNKK
ncbi:MAG: hypothetical protein U1D97_05945 [Desulfuromonadales bacterium]|nr:hypothetical protein [Desulfuromonadales bacterium]